MNGYVLIAVAIFLAFAIGNGFMFLVSLIQKLVRGLYIVAGTVWTRFCGGALRKVVQRFTPKNKPSGPIIRMLNVLSMRAIVGSQEDWRKIWSCWIVLAEQLLKTAYGIDPNNLKSDAWESLYLNLGTPTPEDVRGSLIVIASHATGWAGLVAIQLAPALRNRYFLSFCALMVFVGLIHDFHVAERTTRGYLNGCIAIRAVLRDLKASQPKVMAGPSS